MSAMFSVKEDYEVDEAGSPLPSGRGWHYSAADKPCLDCWTAPTPDSERGWVWAYGYSGFHEVFLRPVGSPGCPHGRGRAVTSPGPDPWGDQTPTMPRTPTLRLVPVTRDQAHAAIATWHRHHQPPQGYRYAVGAALTERLVGVATAGRPVARHLDDGLTIEVTRVATDGTPHACSMLYGACWRAARALGYRRAVTYTQAGESGASLRAAGWTHAATRAARSGWDMPGRRRDRGVYVPVDRLLWVVETSEAGALPTVWPASGDTDPALFEAVAA